MSADRVEALLAAAREARADDRTAEVLARLREAAAEAALLGDEHPLRQVTAWRLAKAEYDFGSAVAMLEALRPILAHDDPFDHYPAGLQAADRLARRYWDHVGYQEPLVLDLWDAASRAWERAGDPYLAAVGQVQKAWQLACRGERDALRALLDHYGNLTPRTFGDGPHRHPRAADAPSSVYWVQLDLGRTILWSACWTRDERLGWEALEVFEDAAEGAGVAREGEVWYLDPAVRAGRTFDWKEPRGLEGAWLASLRALDGPRGALHLALAEGVLARAAGDPATAAGRFVKAAAAAEAATAGPEWVADALVEAHRTVPDEALRARAAALVQRHAVNAFAAYASENAAR